MTTISLIDEVLPGIDSEREPSEIAALMQLNMGQMPETFPIHLWNEQMGRYAMYWYWWQGKIFEEIEGHTAEGDKVYKYPLKINTMRTFARIHNTMLWGEAPDDKSPLVRTRIVPAESLIEEQPTDEAKKIARFYERIVAEIWRQSNGRAILWEQGLLSQFLGGSYFQISYQPWRRDLRIPLVIKPLKADFVLPIWHPDDPWQLLEAYIVYRMTPRAANETYGLKDAPSQGSQYITYVEHWTRETYSAWVGGKPLVANYFVPGVGRVEKSYNNQKHPFGIVPIVYIPRIREGNFFGSSFIPDISSLVTELNSRMADAGDVIMQTASRKWFGVNITQTPRPKQFDNGQMYTDLGTENPAFKNPPNMWAEDPPPWSPAMTQFNEDLLKQIDREGFVSPIAFGVDEGSQRSGVTLQVRMWPTIALARAQRHFWTAGLNQIARNALVMLSALGVKIDGLTIPPDFIQTIEISQQWYSYLPIDEEQLVNKLVQLKSTGQMSVRRSLMLQDDVDDIEEEMKRIEEDEKRAAELSAAMKPPTGNGQAGGTNKPAAPVANSSK